MLSSSRKSRAGASFFLLSCESLKGFFRLSGSSSIRLNLGGIVCPILEATSIALIFTSVVVVVVSFYPEKQLLNRTAADLFVWPSAGVEGGATVHKLNLNWLEVS